MPLFNQAINFEQTKLAYLVSNQTKKPGKLWISSGIHGDESSVISPLRELVLAWTDQLPDLVFVPQISQSAFELKTRNNHFGHDLNRMFGSGIKDPELVTTEQLVKLEGPFDLVVSFHEDIEFDLAYFFDTGEPFYELELKTWQEKLRNGGIKLLDGLDDLENLVLAREFISGYHQEISSPITGLFECWVVSEKLAKRSLTIEVPTAATLEQKKLIIDETFRHLILPAFK